MKEMYNKIQFVTGITLVMLCLPLWAVFPEPLIHLDFEKNLDNHGLLGERGYLPWPQFAPGIALNTDALDLTEVKTAGIKLGQAGQSLQQALNGLQSFTICMWVKFESLPDSGSYLWSRRADSGPWDYVLRLYQDQWGRPRQTINLVNGPLEPAAFWGVTGKWQFVAVTYDGTQSVQNEIYYQQVIDQTSMKVIVRDRPAAALQSSSFPIEFGTAVEGMIDEVRLFGSKTDSSGVLTLSQLEEIHALDLEYAQPDPVFDDPFEALVYLPFENDWNNHGSAQPDTAQVSFVDGIQPQFGTGLRKTGLDLSAAQMGKAAGCVNFGIPGTENTPVEEALNGLKSLTLCGWFHTAAAGNRLLTNTGFCGRLGQLMLRSYDNDSHMVLGVNNLWTPVDGDIVFDQENQWVFFAVTYDSTRSSGHVHWYKAIPDTAGGVQSVKSHDLSAGPLQEKDSELTVANLLASGAYSFSGYFDEFRIFGSKDNASGALDIQQIQEIYEYDLQPVCGSDIPIPPGDTNRDCIINFKDFIDIASGWMFISTTNSVN